MFLQHKDCIVFGYINHMIILLLAYVRYPHTVLRSGCISLHFTNSMNLRVSFSSLPHQHMLSFVFLIRANLLSAVISHYGFDLYFSGGIEQFFYVHVGQEMFLQMYFMRRKEG